MERASPSAGTLHLDAQTREDLQLFAADEETPSLYALLNHCQTEGGERVLRDRMRSPSNHLPTLLETQRSVMFLGGQAEALPPLPSRYLTASVERYLGDPIPQVIETANVEFHLSAFTLWLNSNRFYHRILAGVQFTCRFLGTLRRFIEQTHAADPAGELRALVEEAQTLLDAPALAGIPIQASGGIFAILRLDQCFRVTHRSDFNRLLALLHEIDALNSLAIASAGHGFTLPEFTEGATAMEADAVFHPFIEGAVANPVHLTPARRLLFLTGPNMAGKTTYLRGLVTALYLAHLGMGVPARSLKLTPIDRLITAISIRDDLNSGISYFRAEALRVKSIAEAIAEGERVVAVLDEPFKGTNVKDAHDASHAVLELLAQRQNCLFVACSHLIELGDRFRTDLPIAFGYFEAKESGNRLGFDYTLHDGVSAQRLGMRVLREEGVFDLLDGGPGGVSG